MQKDLLSELIEKPQREDAGADVASRFNYQKNWAFCQMIRRHMSDADYLVAFEFHDDVVFLEPSGHPTKADFCQVKTSKATKPKKLTDLISPKRQNTNSILGKMCMNFDGICSEHDTQVLLISNVAFEFSDKDICAKDLDEKYRKKIYEKLVIEIPSLTIDDLSKIHFLISGVSIDSMNSFLQGEVAELFKFELGEDHGVNFYSWIRLVQGEINRKNNEPSGDINSVNTLVENKCISRQFVSETIAYASRNRSVPPDMALFNAYLKDKGWTIMDLSRISQQISNATSDYFDASNIEVAAIVKRITNHLNSLENKCLSKFLHLVGENNKQVSGEISLYSDKYYIWALAILVYHEKI